MTNYPKSTLGQPPTVIPPRAADNLGFWVTYLGRVWGLCPELCCRLIDMRTRLACGQTYWPMTIGVQSGVRTEEDQVALGSISGHLSTHVPKEPGGCSTGADLLILPKTEAAYLQVGFAAEAAGLRWGGGADRDSRGIPMHGEHTHVDLGRKWG